MKFYDNILKWKLCGDSIVNVNGNELICHVHKEIKDDYLHVLFYSLGKKMQKQFEKKFDLKKNKGLKEYSMFIFRHNGSVLYSGAIVFFGFTENNTANTFIEPCSLEKMNEMNEFVYNNPSYLFIGNIMHRDFDNIDIFVNKITGYLLWMHKSRIFKEFNSLNQMLDYIINYYDPFYNSKGENINFNDRKKNVYENIQLY